MYKMHITYCVYIQYFNNRGNWLDSVIDTES